jgi:hypothetical protein
MIRSCGLHARDISAVAAAAGGPKGLALLGFDRWLFGDWLKDAPRRRLLAGASIGAWRLAAAAQIDPLPALDRLEEAYLEMQRYPEKPGAKVVSQICRSVVQTLTGGQDDEFLATIAPDHVLQIVTARGREDVGRYAERRRFALAAIDNALGRDRLAKHLQRVMFCSQLTGLPEATAQDLASSESMLPDAFNTHRVKLSASNLEDALLASGSIPLLADPVRTPHGAPQGAYWDGGLIDYHLYWRWRALDGIVLYPHFTSQVTAGWLDKFLPWRRHGIGLRGHDWLDNVLLVVPSQQLLARLPNGKLPDRKDFYRYGTNHDARLRDWRRAIRECTRMADEFSAFVKNPDSAKIEAL